MPLPKLALALGLGVGAWLLSKKRAEPSEQERCMAQAPVDANNMLAIVTAPSYQDVAGLDNYADQFKAGANSAALRGDQVQAFRLARYAEAAKFKADAIRKGATAGTEGLVTIALTPFTQQAA